jgi:hypothetical protein
MRLILGMILGAALTVGGAYISDTAMKPAPGTGATHGQLGRGQPEHRFGGDHDQDRLGEADQLTSTSSSTPGRAPKRRGRSTVT